VEIALVVAFVVLAGALVVRTLAHGRAIAVALLVVATSASAAVFRPKPHAELPASRPRTTESATYVSSNGCLGCHPGEHASFRRTFHRTMTQDANDKTVLAPFERRGDEVFHEGKRIVLTTGSHREQAYWVDGQRPGELALVPFVWMIREKKMLLRADAFLTPPDVPLGATHWAGNCIACHAVAGEPRRDEAGASFATRAAELGITCEACHGPGAAHVDRHRDPVDRWLARGKDDPTIVNPKKLPPDRASAVCGQCHAYAYPRDEAEWWKHGYARTFRAGDALAPSRHVILPHTFDRKDAPRIDADIDSLFWKDGTIRVGGREYNGMIASKCTKGGITCTSCHAMHRGDPAGQIAPDRTGDRGCVSCHSSMKADHSHHRDVACVDCHMPKTSYALLSAVRSHRIDSPDLASDKPNACNLCHLDRSQAWTAGILETWYGRKAAPASADPEGARLALAGDAAMRVLVADALGSPGAIAASGRAWQAPLLAELRRDPYAAVRFVAERSAQSVDASGPALDAELVRRLLAARDLRGISIAE
jgi:predicted CXXCH cytochrome family protein